MTKQEMVENVRGALASLGVTSIPWDEPNPPDQPRKYYRLAATSRTTLEQIAESQPEPKRAQKLHDIETFYGDGTTHDMTTAQVCLPRHSTFFDGMSFDQWLDWVAGRLILDGYADYDLEPLYPLPDFARKRESSPHQTTAPYVSPCARHASSIPGAAVAGTDHHSSSTTTARRQSAAGVRM